MFSSAASEWTLTFLGFVDSGISELMVMPLRTSEVPSISFLRYVCGSHPFATGMSCGRPTNTLYLQPLANLKEDQ